MKHILSIIAVVTLGIIASFVHLSAQPSSPSATILGKWKLVAVNSPAFDTMSYESQRQLNAAAQDLAIEFSADGNCVTTGQDGMPRNGRWSLSGNRLQTTILSGVQEQGTIDQLTDERLVIAVKDGNGISYRLVLEPVGASVDALREQNMKNARMLVRTWSATDITGDDITESLRKEVDSLFVGTTLVFHPDGNSTLTMTSIFSDSPSIDRFRYAVKDNVITMLMSSGKTETATIVSLTDSNLVLSAKTDDNKQYTLTFKAKTPALPNNRLINYDAVFGNQTAAISTAPKTLQDLISRKWQMVDLSTPGMDTLSAKTRQMMRSTMRSVMIDFRPNGVCIAMTYGMSESSATWKIVDNTLITSDSSGKESRATIITLTEKKFVADITWDSGETGRIVLEPWDGTTLSDPPFNPNDVTTTQSVGKHKSKKSPTRTTTRKNKKHRSANYLE